MSRRFLPLLSALAVVLIAGPAFAQGTGPQFQAAQVRYRNAKDSTVLTAALTLPSGPGPFPGVVLMSIAGTDQLVNRLAGLGYAVLIPIRRGFVAVEPLLQATYQDLADDGQAAVDYMRARPDVDDVAVSLIGQGDDGPPAMMAAVGSSTPIPLVLLAPPGFPGTEYFRLEQRWLAQGHGWRPPELEALDRFLAQIASIVLTERSPYIREYELEDLISTSEIRLPYNAAFPTDNSQAHFFSSPLWHDRLAFDPEQTLARLHSPVLLLIGTEDLNSPMERYLEGVERGLSGAVTKDVTVCVVEGRVRHYYTDQAVEMIAEWIVRRSPRAGARPGAGAACADEALRGR